MEVRLAPSLAAAGVAGGPEASFNDVYRYFSTEAAAARA